MTRRVADRLPRPVPCPRCEAPAGASCRSAAGNPTDTHGARIGLASRDTEHVRECECRQCRRDDARVDRALAEMRGNRPVPRPVRDKGWTEPVVRSPSAGKTATGQPAGDCALVKTEEK